MEKFMMILMSLISILYGVTMVYVNKMSRPGVYFGVTISKEVERDQVYIKLAKRYKVSCMVIAIITAATILILRNPLPLIFQIVISFIPFLMAHDGVKNLKVEKANIYDKETYNKVLVNTDISARKLSYKAAYLWLYLIPLAICLVSFYIGYKKFDLAPDKIPMHYDLAGNVNRYGAKTFGNYYFASLMNIVLTLIMFLSNLAILSMKQGVIQGSKEETIKRQVKARAAWSYYLLGLSIIMSAMMLIMQLMTSYGSNYSTWILVATMIIVVYSIGLGIYIGMKYGSMGESYENPNREGTERDDDKYWHFFGTIYVNKDDPSVFVPKKVGSGGTVNFGNKVGILITIAIPVAIIALVIALTN